MLRLTTIIAAFILISAAVTAESMGYANWEQIGQVVIAATLFVLIYQVIQERKAQTFEVFRNLLKDYSAIISEEATDTRLADIWGPLDEARRTELNAAQMAAKGEDWGAWRVMTVPERQDYWRTRRVFDLFEMAFLARKDLWLNKKLWQRWETLIQDWVGTR